MQIHITHSEWYPVLTANKIEDGVAPFGKHYEVSEETFARWQKAEEDFDAMQTELEALSPSPQ